MGGESDLVTLAVGVPALLAGLYPLCAGREPRNRRRRPPAVISVAKQMSQPRGSLSALAALVFRLYADWPCEDGSADQAFYTGRCAAAPRGAGPPTRTLPQYEGHWHRHIERCAAGASLDPRRCHAARYSPA